MPCQVTVWGLRAGQAAAERRHVRGVLHQHGTQVTLIMLESALRARVGSAPALAGQRDRLTAISGLASVELGISPAQAAVAVFPPSGFRRPADPTAWPSAKAPSNRGSRAQPGSSTSIAVRDRRYRPSQGSATGHAADTTGCGAP